MAQTKIKKDLGTTQVVLRLLATYITISFSQRIVFIVWVLAKGNSIAPEWISVFGKGLIFDLCAALFLFLPIALSLTLAPRNAAQSRAYRIGATLLAATPLFLACCAAFGEIFFFDEFHARYNFIAVDYLVYTTEVVRNILESYSVALLGLGIVVPAVLLAIVVNRLIKRWHPQREWTILLRQGVAVGLVALCAYFVTEDSLLVGNSYWPREFSKNSIFALFSAYNRNSINYLEFYSSLDPKEALRRTGEWLEPNAPLSASPPLQREIHAAGEEKHWNVVMVVMESMSAGFMGKFGNKQPITQNLDHLADNGLFFTHLFATGTRTVRGLEALMLSLPPTPGQSILRRPGSDGLFNLGTVFSQHGYQTQFVYGGYAYFDNMKEWFEGNGFQVVDRATFPKEEIHFGNAWGVCDEDLFDQVLKQQSEITANGKPFFQVVLTTSNHRPYTYPEGRIDMPPHNGREGAIKYSDFAIGKFIEEAKTKPWFKNTIFIFVADHDASVAGGTDIPVQDYRIPAIFYNPQLIPTEKNEKLASQIDLGPTLLGLLNFSYQSRFFGADLTREPGGRALLGTYQKVALLQPNSLIVLSPGRSVETQVLNDNNGVVKSTTIVATDASQLPAAAQLTVSIYQSASELFAGGLLKIAGKPGH